MRSGRSSTAPYPQQCETIPGECNGTSTFSLFRGIFVASYESDSGAGRLFAFFVAHLQRGQSLVNQFDLHPGIFVDVVLVGEDVFYVCFQFLPGVLHFYQREEELLSIAA